jgi:putative oxidoreductase
MRTDSPSFHSGRDNSIRGDSTVVERYSLIAARILISIIFLLNGLNIIDQTFAAHEMAAHGVPVSLIPALIIGARTLQLIAGPGLAFGIYPRLSSLALLLFLIPATLMAHAFWQVPDTAQYMVQMINFFKNVCMAGGLIFISAAKDQPVLRLAKTRLTHVHTSLSDQVG